ncbi:MAG: hypothetical protein ACLR23_16800 [Clostridia bacterium]
MKKKRIAVAVCAVALLGAAGAGLASFTPGSRKVGLRSSRRKHLPMR